MKLDLMEWLELLAQMVLLVLMEAWELLELQVFLEKTDPLEEQESQEPPVKLVHLVWQEQSVHLDPLDRMALLVLTALME